MNVKATLAAVRFTGMTCSRTEHGEYRVNFPGGGEGTAYYTDDAQDAVDTARAMAATILGSAEFV